MESRYVLQLMFEWQGGCLWCDNEAAREKLGVGPVEDRLPLSPETRRRLIELTEWHDRSLNWEYLPDPGPWPPEEYERFDRAAVAMLDVVRAELGDRKSVV